MDADEGGGSAYHKHWRVVAVTVRKSDCTLSKEISGCYAVLLGNRILSHVQLQERVQQIRVKGIAFVNLSLSFKRSKKDAYSVCKIDFRGAALDLGIVLFMSRY